MVSNLFYYLGRKLTRVPVESSRVGVVKALVDRAVTLRSHEGDLIEVCRAFNNFLNVPLKFLTRRCAPLLI